MTSCTTHRNSPSIPTEHNRCHVSEFKERIVFLNITAVIPQFLTAKIVNVDPHNRLKTYDI
jgi:hypothetical protein